MAHSWGDREDFPNLDEGEAVQLLQKLTERQDMVMCPSSETTESFKRIGRIVGNDWKTLKDPIVIGNRQVYLRPNNVVVITVVCFVTSTRLIIIHWK